MGTYLSNPKWDMMGLKWVPMPVDSHFSCFKKFHVFFDNIMIFIEEIFYISSKVTRRQKR